MYLIEMQSNIFPPSINIDNVQSILSQSNQNLSSNAEKCKEFIKMHMKSNAGMNGPPNMAALMSFINHKIESTTKLIVSPECSTSSSNINHLPTSVSEQTNNNNISEESNQFTSTTRIEAGIDMAKLYIDNKLINLEQNIMKTIDKRFDEMEKRQNEQFQLIMATLQNNDKFLQ